MCAACNGMQISDLSTSSYGITSLVIIHHSLLASIPCVDAFPILWQDPDVGHMEVA